MNFKTSTIGTLLIIFGTGIAALYEPSGLLHTFIGSGVYGRDLLLGMHLMLLIMYFISIEQFKPFIKVAWPIIIFALFFSPLFQSRSQLKDLLITLKWYAIWLDWMGVGYLIALRPRMPRLAVACLVLTYLFVFTDACIGFKEIKTNHLVLPAEANEDTAAGVTASRSQTMDGNIRAQGLQRDVFSFGNLMGVGFTTCLCIVALRRGFFTRASCLAMAAFFAYVGLFCGGRSVLFGMMLVSLLFIVAMYSSGYFKLYASRIMGTAIAVEGIVACIGIGYTLLYVITALNLHLTVLNLDSSFERDQVWRERLGLMFDYPISTLIGMPSAFYVARNGDPINFVDNLPLWIFYHTGIIGVVFFTVFFAKMCRRKLAYLHPSGYLVFIFFMGLVWGEGLARDTLGMYGCLPMFGAAGFLMGKEYLADRLAKAPLEESVETESLVEA